jgi:hypothetical protein
VTVLLAAWAVAATVLAAVAGAMLRRRFRDLPADPVKWCPGCSAPLVWQRGDRDGSVYTCENGSCPVESITFNRDGYPVQEVRLGNGLISTTWVTPGDSISVGSAGFGVYRCDLPEDFRPDCPSCGVPLGPLAHGYRPCRNRSCLRELVLCDEGGEPVEPNR